MIFRSLLYHLFFYFFTIILAIVALPLFAMPSFMMRHLARFWGFGCLKGLYYIVGLDYRLIGQENLPKRPCIIASKHQSMWETIAFCYLFPKARIVAKRELFWIPIFGWGMKKADFIPINRGKGVRALRELLRESAASLDKGYHIILFPEGTRVPFGQKIDYKAGALALYSHLDAPCVPVILNSGLFWGRRSFLRLSGCVEVHILKPIPPSLNKQEFKRVLRSQLESQLEKPL